MATIHYCIPTSVLRLPLVAAFVLFREQILHDGGNDATVGNKNGILTDLRKGFQNTLSHLLTIFAPRRDVTFIIA